ncbi:MAG TPA: hypothetical protein VNV43_04765 [Candidatus Acidoferrales bacterium]|jgi:hypothetical protein|nr:hypothetical protein [Candidatus Acidoferrales bacterium]
MSQFTTTLTDDELDRINQCASRLRLIQSDSAALAPERRREYLHDEISQSFKEVSPANRKRLLEALLTRFPSGGPTSAPPAPVSPAAAGPDTPQLLLERFLKLAAQLPQEEKAAFARRLAEAGIGAPAERAPVGFEITDAMRQRLGIQPGREPNPQRLIEVTALLLQTLHDLDRAAMLTLKELNPRAALLNRPKGYWAAPGQYMAGDSKEIESFFRTVSALLGGMLAAMLGGGRDFGRQLVERYAPSAIEQVVEGEGGGSFIPGMGRSKTDRCWDKYKTISKDIATPDLVDKWVRDCLGKFVEARTRIG